MGSLTRNHFGVLAILCLCILFQVTPCHSQNDQFPEELFQNRITVEDGISSDIATCFLQDSQGFIWIGTDNGLNRYDGYGFKTFSHNEFDTTSISGDYIVCLCEDFYGHIWIGTFYNGLNKYDPEKETFTRYPVNRNDPHNLSSSAIFGLCPTTKREVWFSAIDGQSQSSFQSIYGVDPVTDEIRYISADPIVDTIPANIHCHSIFEDSKGIIWAGSADCLLKYDTSNRVFIKVQDYSPGIKRIRSEITCIAEDRNNDLWIGVWKEGAYKLSTDENRISEHFWITDDTVSEVDNSPYAIHLDVDGNLTFKLSNSISLFDQERGLFTFWDFENQLTGVAGNLNLRALYSDNTGLLWFGLPSGSDFQAGIYRIRLDEKRFTHISGEKFVESNLENVWINSICEDRNGDIWLGGHNTGLIRIEKPYSGQSIHRYHANSGDPFSLSSNNITAIFQDSEGILWVGCWEEGILHRFNRSETNEKFISYKTQDHFESGELADPKDAYRFNDQSWDFTGAGCMRIFEDSQNRLWIGRGTGLELFDRDRGSFFSYELGPADTGIHKNPVITDIEEGRSGELWVATMYKGLIKLNPPYTLITPDTPGGKKSIHGSHLQITSGDLKDAMITSLCVPSKNEEIDLWIGTWGRGLVGLIRNPEDPGKDSLQIVQYTTEKGLPDNVVLGIQEDDMGYLWISTQRQLSKLDPSGRVINSYDLNDGVMIKRFHWLSNQKGRSGNMYFGGEEGLLLFHPEQIVENSVIPPIAITDFRLFNQHVPVGENSPLKKSITRTDRIELTYQENFLSFQFAALNYENTGKNRYRYKMEGIDRDWVDAGITRNASYPNMRHGRYTFRVLGANNDGIWNDKGASVDIFIRPPPWLSWWAYGIYFLLILGLFLGYRNYLMNRTKLQTAYEVERIEKEKVQELDHLKSSFFANISHEFRTPLTLITGPINDLLKSESRSNERDNKLLGMMKRNTRRLQQLINQLLEISTLETGRMKLEVSEGDLSGFLRPIANSFLSLAEKKKIRLEIDIKETVELVFFDRDKVEKIVTNLISNAMKFTQEGGSVSVVLNYLIPSGNKPGMQAEIVVSDNGPGIPVKEKDKVFDRFHQVESHDGRYTEGTGIGLALVKELIDFYKGMIKLESEIGIGTSFRVMLPVSKEQFTEDEIVTIITDTFPSIDDSIEFDTSQHAKGKPEDGKPIILVVEDNSDLRGYISQILLSDYRIIEAENGRSGLQVANERIPDLVISDLMMPEMDGIEMCEQLKSDHRTCHIPLIMLTAKADKTSKLESFGMGADDFILKPFDAEELKARVENLIEQRERLRERYKKEFITDPGSDSLSEPADEFLDKVLTCVKENLSHSEYNVERLGKDVGFSQAQLYRKLIALTNYSPNEFIRNFRLKMAARMFHQGHKNITTVLYSVGFNTPSHFSKCFKQLFGVIPSEYIRQIARSEKASGRFDPK